MRFWRQWAIVSGLCAVGFFFPIRFETDAQFYIRLMDAAHLPAFFALTLFAYRYWPFQITPSLRRLAAAGSVAVASVMIEVAQPIFGRSESMVDFANGMAGVVLALAFLVGGTFRSRFLCALTLCGLSLAGTYMAFLPAWRESAGMRWRWRSFPVLASLEEEAEMRLWIGSGLGNIRGDGTLVERVREHSTHGYWALKVVTNTDEKWPGVRLLNGKQDWSGKMNLCFDVWNEGPALTLAMRVDDDFRHKDREDRFNSEIQLRPGLNQITIPISEIESRPANRRLNLRAIQRMVFYVNDPKRQYTFFIDHVRLE